MKKSFNIELPQDFDEYGALQCWYFTPILLTPAQENVVRELVGKKSGASIIFDVFTEKRRKAPGFIQGGISRSL